LGGKEETTQNEVSEERRRDYVFQGQGDNVNEHVLRPTRVVKVVET